MKNRFIFMFSVTAFIVFIYGGYQIRLDPVEHLNVPHSFSTEIQEKISGNPNSTSGEFAREFETVIRGKSKVTAKDIKDNTRGSINYNMKYVVCGHHWDMTAGAKCDKPIRFAIYKLQRKHVAYANRMSKNYLFQLMALDLDKNSEVTEEEFVDALSSHYQSFDESCKTPPVPENAEVIHVNPNNSFMRSNIAFSKDAEPTPVTHLKISDGNSPLYIIGSTHGPTLWNITGAKSRVKHFIAHPSYNSRNPEHEKQVGIAGLAPQSVHFVPATCHPQAHHPERGQRLRHKIIQQVISKIYERRVSHKVDATYAFSRMKNITLPDGIMEVGYIGEPSNFTSLKPEDLVTKASLFEVSPKTN